MGGTPVAPSLPSHLFIARSLRFQYLIHRHNSATLQMRSIRTLQHVQQKQSVGNGSMTIHSFPAPPPRSLFRYHHNLLQSGNAAFPSMKSFLILCFHKQSLILTFLIKAFMAIHNWHSRFISHSSFALHHLKCNFPRRDVRHRHPQEQVRQQLMSRHRKARLEGLRRSLVPPPLPRLY